MKIKEYKFLRLNMESISIIYGLSLILWGVIVNYSTSSSSITSLIPSFLGVPILFFSILAIIFSSKKKLFMHIVVLFGVLIFIGGLDVLRSVSNGNFLNLFWADVSKTMMLITGIFFTYLCVQSFIFARKNR
tara:strand:- start:231 stop:626 length:396 start_codon:yes stop_codon:yes gene_type:complete